MDKFDKVLYIINQREVKSQRDLAASAGISVGQANSILKELEAAGCIEKKQGCYYLKKKGRKALEEKLRQNLEQRISFDGESQKRLRTAVILAAGEEKNFECPSGLLTLDGEAAVDILIRKMMNLGIEQFYIVTGYEKERYEEHFRGRNVHLVENPRYKWTGTMASLAQVRPYVKEDFLLVECNQILEEGAFEKVIYAPGPDSLLLVNPSGSADCAYVEMDKHGNIFRISKDIRQMNKIDGELVGVSKISRALFDKMMEYYQDNENPFLNYEYVIENIGRLYKIQGVIADDLVWGLLEDEAMYAKAENLIYPRIKIREKLAKENNARATLKECLQIEEKDIEKLRIIGGMTNMNFYVRTCSKKEYILRMPGAATEEMISRSKEQFNTLQASLEGFHPQILYFNVKSGVKVTEYIKGAQTLNGKTARLETNMKRTASILKRLHQSEIQMQGEFDVWKEYESYAETIKNMNGRWYQESRNIEPFFYRLRDDLEALGRVRKPCHNDLVPENLVKDETGRMYLIDWEYSGFNDPMWDVAAHLLEGEFSKDEEELFLSYYFENGITDIQKQKIEIFKMCQDILWSAWTIIKEAKGEDLGTYGKDRLARAVKGEKEYEKRYGKR